MQISIRKAHFGFTLLIIVLVAGGIAMFSLRLGRQAMLKSAKHEFQTATRALGDHVLDKLEQGDESALKSKIEKLLKFNPTLQYLAVVDESGKSVAATANANNPVAVTTFLPSNITPQDGVGKTKATVVERKDGSGLLVRVPIVDESGKKHGQIVGFYSLALNRSIQKAITTSTFLSTVIFGGIGSILSIWFSWKLTRPIIALTEAARQIMKHNFKKRVKTTRQRELATLVDAINQMAEEVESSTVSKDYVTGILRSMPDGLIVCNADAVIDSVNPSLVEICQRDARSLVGRNVSEILRDEHGGALNVVDASKVEGDYDGLLDRNGGKPVPVSIACSSISAPDSQNRGWVIMVKDITERKAAEQNLTDAIKEAERANDEKSQMLVELEELACKDPLTGLLNRRTFIECFIQSLEHAQRHNEPLGVALLDLDFFKRVNDEHGHAAGDAVLRHAASILREFTRSSDQVCRYGGEEFCVLLPKANLDQVRNWAERVRQQFESKLAIHDNLQIPQTTSIGVATLTSEHSTPDELIELADQALYTAKRNGRNRVYVYGEVEANKSPINAADSENRYSGVLVGEMTAEMAPSLNINSSLRQAAQILSHSNSNALLLVDEDGDLQGTIHSSDLLDTSATLNWDADVTEYMHTNVVKFNTTTPAHVVAAFLERNQVSEVVIVHDDIPIGLINRLSLLRWLCDNEPSRTLPVTDREPQEGDVATST
jgi:diguanylate cyclase (GGDEF)-like protein/PAS domain S-box-containing protein